MRNPIAISLSVLLVSSLASVSIADEHTDSLAGSYIFSTMAKAPNGQPVCEEHWTFAPDGVATIRSGEEVVHERYRVEVVDGDHWLIESKIDTNGAPDCLGATAPPTQPELRLYFYFNAGGGFVLCRKPGQHDGAKVVSGCYAYTTPER
jgi:hypothetical protein